MALFNNLRLGSTLINRAYLGANLAHNKYIDVTPDMYSYRVYNYGGDAMPAISPFSDLVFSTDATGLDVVCRSTLTSDSLAYAIIGIYVNGVLNQSITFTTAELSTMVTRSITLPAGTKEVFLRTGSSSTGVTGDIIRGQYVSKVTVTSGTRIIPVKRARKAKRCVFVTDSIGVGFNTTVPTDYAFINRMRIDSRLIDWEVASHGWGSNVAVTMFTDAASINVVVSNIVTYMAGATDKVIYMQVGTNDYGVVRPTPAVYAARVAAFYDALYLADPTIKIISVTAFPRTQETANPAGFTLPQYRTALLGVATTRPFVRNIDGTTVVIIDETSGDGIHYTDFGNRKLAEFFLRDILGIAQALPILPDGQYMVSSLAATGFVTVPTSTSISLITKPVYTLTFIIRRTRTQVTDPVFAQGAANGALYIAYLNTNVFRIGVAGAVNGYFDISFNDIPLRVGGWHHWEISKEGLVYEVRVDGFLITTVTKTVNQTVAGNVTIGAFATQYSALNLDRVRIYNKKLTDAERLLDRYSPGLTDFTNVAAEYLMNGNANDTSPNLNNGTVGSTVTFPSA